MIIEKENLKRKDIPDPKEWLLDNFETGKEDTWPSQQQLDCFGKMCNNEMLQKLIVKSYRNSGLTTLILYAMAYRVVTAPGDQTILYVSHSRNSSHQSFSKFKEILDTIDEGVIVSESGINFIKLRLVNNLCDVTVMFRGDERDIFLRKKYDYTFIDNAAFIDTFTVKDVYDCTNEEFVIASTPNYKDDFFYSEYVKTLGSKECIYGESDIFNLVWYLDDRKVDGLQWRRKTYDKDGNWVDDSIGSTVVSPDFALSMFQAGYYPWSSWYEEMCNIFGNDYKAIMQEVEGSFVDMLPEKEGGEEEEICPMYDTNCPTVCPKDCRYYDKFNENEEKEEVW